MKYYFIAGEASGDLHGSNLMAEIITEDSNAQFRFLGGELMASHAKQAPLKHYKEMAFMGIVDVLANIRTIKRNMDKCKADILEFKPDVLILIDYPGFNLKIAKFAHEHNIRVDYYISPKIWAWKRGRIHQIKAYVDNMYTIFPFETKFYKQYDFDVDFVGNPLFDSIKKRPMQGETFNEFTQALELNTKPVIALVPGSRKKEIQRILPAMASVVDHFPEYQFIITGAPNFDQKFYDKILTKKIPVVFNETYRVIQQADAALVTSGTATLETALLETPQVVCYKMENGKIVEWLRPFVLKTEHFSLVNIIAEKEVVKELFQSNCNTEQIKQHLREILTEEGRGKMLQAYQEIQQSLGGAGASKNAAKLIVQRCMNPKKTS